MEIEIKESFDSIFVKIEDTGIGRAKAKELKRQKNLRKQVSSGVSISEERIEKIIQLNLNKNTDFQFKITDKYDSNNQASGTMIEIQLPKIVHKKTHSKC